MIEDPKLTKNGVTLKKNVTSLAEMLGFKHLQKKHAQWAQTLKTLAELESKPGYPLKPIPPPLIKERNDSQIELSKFGESVPSKITSSMNLNDDEPVNP